MARIASARLLGGPCQAEHRAGQNFANLHLYLLTNRCFVDAKRVLLGAWNLQWILVIKTGRLVRAKRPLLEKRGKAHATSVAPAPTEPASCEMHFGNQYKTCTPLRPNTTFFCDAGLRHPAEDDERDHKTYPFGKVSSRARETITFAQICGTIKWQGQKMRSGPDETPSFEQSRIPVWPFVLNWHVSEMY